MDETPEMQVSDFALKFKEENLGCCDVEFADSGDDIVYHFWPTRGLEKFPDNFAKNLENAFKSVLPTTADVRAEFISKKKAAVFLRYNDDPNKDSIPVPTYYVRVIGWSDNPMAEVFLKKRVFSNLDEYYREM